MQAPARPASSPRSSVTAVVAGTVALGALVWLISNSTRLRGLLAELDTATRLVVVGGGTFAATALLIGVVWRRRAARHGQPRPTGGRRSIQEHQEDPRAAAERQLRQVKATLKLTDREAKVCADELAQLADLEYKLSHGVLQVVFWGTVSSGKSSVINALLGKPICSVNAAAGTTRQVAETTWEARSAAGGLIRLVDTPGINEVSAEVRAKMARETAEGADLLILVVDADLRQQEYELLQHLLQAGKPIIVAMNKIDAYTATDREVIVHAIRARLGSLVPLDNIVTVSASPRPRVVVERGPDGQTVEVEEPVPIDIEALQQRLLALLSESSNGLLAANVLGQLECLTASMQNRINEIRDREAQRLVKSYTTLSAFSLALNPVPGLDLAANAALHLKLFGDLGRVYDRRLDVATVSTALHELGAGLAVTGASQAAALVAGSVLKTVPGLGTVVGGALQGLVGGYTTHLLGNAFAVFCRTEGAWGSTPPASFLDAASGATDSRSLMTELAASLLQRLARRRRPR